MTKPNKAEHDQKTINHLNRRLDDLDQQIATCDPRQETWLMRLRDRTTARLMRLYGTEKYALVQ